ncbi:MAG: DUF2505 family protein [Myxococcota bacterium]
MRIQSESVIAHPVASVFEAYRDRLPEVAAYLDDIREIVVQARDEQDGVVTLHNVWASDKEIPSVAKKFVKPEHLFWDDHAKWFTADQRCEWKIVTRAFTEAFSCSGQTRLVAEGESTRIVLDGELSVDVSKVKGIPRFLARTIGPQVEKFIVSLIKPNLERTNVAIGEFLDAQK